MEAGIYLNVTVLTLSRFSTDYNIPNREKRAHRNNYIFLFECNMKKKKYYVDQETWFLTILKTLLYSVLKAIQKPDKCDIHLNWNSLHAMPNSHYVASSYNKKKFRKIKAYRKSVQKEPTDRCPLILD